MFCDVTWSCCTYLTLSLNIDQFLISGDSSFSLKMLFRTTFLYGLSSLIWAVLHVMDSHVTVLVLIMLPSSMALYTWSVCLCQTHGLFVLYVIYFSTCLHFRWQKWGGTILAIYKFKYSTSPSGLLG